MLARRAIAATPAIALRHNASLALPLRYVSSQKIAAFLRVTSTIGGYGRTLRLSDAARQFSTYFRLSATASKSRSSRTGTKAKKKAAPKKKKPKKATAAKKKKKPVKKARKPVKKPLTELDKKLKEVKKLKETALIAEQPRAAPTNGYAIFIQERSQRGGSSGISSEATNEWHTLSEGEKQRYVEMGRANATSSKRTISAWIATKTPEEISNANAARRRLKRMSKDPPPPGRKLKLVNRVPSPLHDPRQVTRPKTAYMIYSAERRSSGDFQGVSATETLKALGNEWRSLGQAEKTRYQQIYERNAEQYRRDFAAAYPNKKPSTAGLA